MIMLTPLRSLIFEASQLTGRLARLGLAPIDNRKPSPPQQQPEDALKDGETRYQCLFDGVPVALYRTTPEGHVLDANMAFVQLLGYPDRQRLLAANVNEIFNNPMDRRRWRAMLEREKIVRDFKTQLRRYDGSTVSVLDNARVVLAPDGQVQYYEGSLLDLSELESAERQLTHERELMNALIEHTPDHVYFKDTESRFLRVSRAMAKWLGLDEPAQAIGKTDFDYFDREHAEPARADELRIMQTGEPVVGIEEREVWPDGRETWVSTTKVALRGRNGQVIGTFGISRNITERKHAEEFLRLTQFSLDSASDAVFWVGADAAFTYVNNAACRLLGYSREELLCMTVHDVNPAYPKERWPKYWTELKQRKSLTFEASLRMKDGRSVPVEMTSNHLEFEGREFNCSFAHNIAERKRAEKEKLMLGEQLRQSQKMEAIGRLAGGVAHDFNNILTVINGYSSILLKALASDDPKRKDLEQIEQAGQRAASLTSQLLAFSRKQIIQPTILDLNDVITEASKILRRLIGEDVDLITVIKPGLGRIKADPEQIQQILMNLAVNARDAMPEGGKLTIETANINIDESYIRMHAVARMGPYVMLAISDSGLGMDEETQAHIFEPFFTTKGPGKGTGLGLSTVYGIVKRAEGFIWVYSEPGRGTTFKIYFPRVEGEIDKVLRYDKERVEPRGTETILVVEDESPLRAFAARILRERGYSVIEASNGEEALHMAQESPEKIHLLLTDVVMPEMSGKALASHIVAMRPCTKVLYISGYTNEAIVHHGILDSDIAFLQKPFTDDELARKIREVIDSVA
jgi:two-component system cell cycle sensor histidine kinase/response regulator CckA